MTFFTTNELFSSDLNELQMSHNSSFTQTALFIPFGNLIFIAATWLRVKNTVTFSVQIVSAEQVTLVNCSLLSRWKMTFFLSTGFIFYYEFFLNE